MTLHQTLFEPMRLGHRVASNRIIQAPLSVCYADENGDVTDVEVDHYSRRARGGAGTVVTENFAISASGRQLPRQTMIDDDSQIPGLRRLARGIQENGALAIAQIVHAGRYAGPWDEYEARRRLAPTAREFMLSPGRWTTPHEITGDEIDQTISDFASAAARAELAGFDGVEIHGAQGFLISQFLSPIMNQRSDGWGGSPQARSRFALAVSTAVRRAVRPGFIVGFHLLADELTPGGWRVRDAVDLARELQGAGIDFLIPVIATFEALHRSENAGLMSRHQYQLAPAAHIARSVSIPVVGNGQLGNPAQIAGLVESGMFSAVALGRPLLVDPDWPSKVMAGMADRIESCPCDPPQCIRTQLTGVTCGHWSADAQRRGYLGLNEHPTHPATVRS